MDWPNIAVLLLYLVGMLAFGVWGSRRITNTGDYLVAGRNLGGVLYTGTMVAVVLGGASAVGGIGLGYLYGLYVFWPVFAIGVDVFIFRISFALALHLLRFFTMSQMLMLRFGVVSTQSSSLIMLAYTLMLAETSSGAYASVFVVIFGCER